MYLAPLNYDRFFKKVFSEERIAKRFLEDFFDIEITEFESLPTKHKITDNSTAVEFDFRCKIKDSYVIIDMQQWFKSDITKRFYMYHSLNTVLQLEKMPDKSLPIDDDKKKETKDYNSIVPVITFIWLADDSLDFTDDFVSFTMSSETVNDFIKNKSLWRDDNILELLKEREKCLAILNNKTKKLDFLQQNKLIYAFQPNIVKNKKLTKYLRWFEFAEKSKDKKNEKSWFVEYLKDDIFKEIMVRISTDSFLSTDWQYVEDFEKFAEQVKRHNDSIRSEGLEEGIEIGFEKGIEKGIVIGEEKGIEKGIEIGVEKGIVIGEEKGIEKGIEKAKILFAKRMKDANKPIDEIQLLTGLDISIIESL